MILRIFIFLILLFPASLLAQSDKEQSIERILEGYIMQENENSNLELMYETLQQLYHSPLNINTVTEEQLQQLMLLTPDQIQNFMIYRKTYGPFISIYELQTIPEFDTDLLQVLKYFLTIKKETKAGSSTEKFGYVMIMHQRSLQKQKGYNTDNDSSGYMGSPDRIQFRIKKVVPEKYSLSIVMEKDAGERLVWNPGKKQFGFDYISSNLTLYNLGRINKLIIGDFQLQFGQGLSAGGGFFLGKGSETILSVRRANTGISPYSSSSEFGFYRGIGLEYKLKNIHITPFLSWQTIDVNYRTDINNSDGITGVSSLYTSGLHRTQGELSKRKNQGELITGGNISYHNTNLHAGVSVILTRFQYHFDSSKHHYQQYNFKGNRNWVISSDYSYRWNNIYLFTEGAISQSKGKGLLTGAIASLNPNIDLSLVYRNYEKDFQSLRANAFSESAEPVNEKGIYIGIKAKLNARWNIFAFSDFYKLPWIKYGIPGPSQGREYMGRVNYMLRKRFSIYGQYKYKLSTSISPDRYSTSLWDYTRETIQIQAEILSGLNLTLKTTGVYSIVSFSGVKENGMILSQDVELRIKKIRLTARVALFETDSYESRVYLYEKDLYMSFYFPSYSGKGIRNYIIMQIPIIKGTDLRIKYGRTKYHDRELIGSGFEEIQSSVKSDLKFQITSKF